MSNSSSSLAAKSNVQKLFLQHAGVLRGFIRAILGDSDLVDDVLNSMFVVVIEKAEQYQPGTDFLAWTKAIARHEVKRAYAAEARKPRALSPETIELLVDEAALVVPEHPDVQLLAKCLDKLAPRSREAIDLRYKDGLKPATIAARICVTQETVYVMLSRARATLKDCLRRGRQREELPR